MFKVIGKLKAGKDKPKREKSDRHAPVIEDARTLSKNLKLTAKEKVEKPIKPTNKASKKKKLHGASSTGDASQSSEDQLVHDRFSQPFNEDVPEVQHTKEKKRISKECEDSVNNAVQEFFECAWKACAERFFITSAPITVSYELRNTWLRIVEAEWQDPDMRGKPAAKPKPNRIFKKDDPPLPLAYDSWSRGALEPLPRFRRESVMDPFLRDVDAYGQLPLLPISNRLPSMIAFHTNASSSTDTDKSVGAEEVEVLEPPSKPKEKPQEVSVNLVAEDKSESDQGGDVPVGDKWNFEIDLRLSDIIEPQSNVTPAASGESIASQHSGENEDDTKAFDTVLSARPFSFEESTTDVDESPTHSTDDSIKRRYKRQLKKFNPNQCGGKAHSGIFRLPMETTSEALRRMKDAGPNAVASEFVARNALEKQDIVHLALKKGDEVQQEEDVEEEEYEVQPLFEERTPRLETSEVTQRENETVWIRRSETKMFFHRRKSAEIIASDLNKRLITRRLLNLHSRFKRQAMRTMPIRAKQREAKKRHMQNPSSPPSSTNSSIFSKASNMSTKSTRTRFPQANKTDEAMKSLTTRASVSSINVTGYHSSIRGAASESHMQIPGHLKINQQQGNQGNQKMGALARSNFKKIGNVRPSYRDFQGKFRSSTRLPPAHLHTHFETTRFPRSGNQGRSACGRCPLKTPSDCQSAASTCSNNIF